MHFSKKVLGLLGAAVLALATVAACGGDKKHLPPLSNPPGGGGAGGGGHGGAGGSGTANCGPGSCTGHSHCEAGGRQCACDAGYLGGKANVGSPLTCTVDTSCVKLKPLVTDSCRFLAGGAPAVASFFAVDYCAGTAVLPNKIGDLSKAFTVTEDGTDVTTNVEASVTVIKKPVESYVTFALDVSKSVADNKDLVKELTGNIGSVLDALENSPAPVGVSILLVGRIVAEFLPFTMDLVYARSKLAELAANPSALVDVGGTSLFNGVKKGIQTTERIEALRDGVSNGGVLSTGTLVAITDGNDGSGATLDVDQINKTVVNIISVGISADIDNTTLTTIGRNGSFLAPDTASRTQAFAEIAQRVKEYPLRSYLLGYCSPKTQGTHTISITMANGTSTAAATCSFDATYFDVSLSGADASAPSCSAAFFTDECKTRDCGGLTGCGACDDDQCCSGGTCVGPTSVSAGYGNCYQQDALCAKDGKLCATIMGSAPVAYECVAPLPDGAECGSAGRCQSGVEKCTKDADGKQYCRPLSPGGKVGDGCGNADKPDHLDCQSLNCGVTSATSGYTCLREARVYEACAGTDTDAECEPGAFCDETTSLCAARRVLGCKDDKDCVTGWCGRGGVCRNTQACYWDWNSKLAH